MPREKQEWSPLPSQRLDAGTRGKFGLGGRRKSHVRTMDQKGRHKSRTHSPLLAAHRRVEMDGVAVDRPGSTLLLTSKLKAGHKTNRPRAICSSLLRRCHPTNHNRGRAVLGLWANAFKPNGGRTIESLHADWKIKNISDAGVPTREATSYVRVPEERCGQPLLPLLGLQSELPPARFRRPMHLERAPI